MLERLLQPRRAWVVVVLGFVLFMALIGGLGEAERTPSATDNSPDGAGSTRVSELNDTFPTSRGSTAVVLFSSDDTLDPAVLGDLGQRFAEVAGDDAPFVPSEDGTAAIGVVTVDEVGSTEIAEAVRDLREEVRADLPDGVTAQVTGPAAVQADLSAVFEGADLRLLAATASVVALLLIVTYRSPVLWLVPLIVVALADRAAVGLATHLLKAVDVTWDESTTGILSVLVFGAGTDYALLLISRYRDELKLVASRPAAMATALRRTSEAVLASSATVVIGLLTLLLSVVPTTRGLGLACAVGVVVAAAAVLCVLPAFLVLFGRWIFWPRIPREGEPTLAESRSLWGRVGQVVARRPVALAVATLLVLAALSASILRVDTGLSPADQFLEKPEAIAASERVAESFPAGSSDPTVVISSASAEEVQTVLAGVPGVESVRPSGEAEGRSRFDLVLSAPAGSAEARATVERVRAAVDGLESTYVGGTTAQSIDEREGAARDRWLLIPLILGLVVLALVLLLRSVVAPLILVLSVVATFFAALGASWLLFTGVLGFDRLDVGVPLLAFLFLVALGVDYNIFLVTRAAEEAPLHGTREAMLRALAATGGVITSAGIVLAAVFAVLGVLPLVVLAQLGVVICIGVLLDTLVVRTVLVPAVAVALGDRFWWPRRFTGDRSPTVL